MHIVFDPTNYILVTDLSAFFALLRKTFVHLRIPAPFAYIFKLRSIISISSWQLHFVLFLICVWFVFNGEFSCLFTAVAVLACLRSLLLFSYGSLQQIAIEILKQIIIIIFCIYTRCQQIL